MRAISYSLIASALLLGACATTDEQKPAAAAPVQSAKPAPAPAPTPVKPQGVTTVETGKSTATSPFAVLKDPNNILSKRSVFFDYDSNSVKDEYKNMVQAHSRYLGDKRDSKIRIEGNCDERGSREYNLALGQRRAESVKKMMTVLGVQDGRIETVSFGEEKPMAPGHDEQAWSQNRRADIKYAGE